MEKTNGWIITILSLGIFWTIFGLFYVWRIHREEDEARERNYAYKPSANLSDLSEMSTYVIILSLYILLPILLLVSYTIFPLMKYNYISTCQKSYYSEDKFFSEKQCNYFYDALNGKYLPDNSSNEDNNDY